MVREGGQHQLRLHPIEYRLILRQDPLDPIRNSDERRAVLLDERLERHGRPATELLDQVIRAREDAILCGSET